MLLGNSVSPLKICNQVIPFVLNLPCFKVLVNESYAYFLGLNDSHIGVNIISILSNT